MADTVSFDICAGWTVNLIPSVIEDIKSGIEHEANRIKGFDLVYMSMHQDWDYDAGFITIDDIKGFNNSSDAYQHLAKSEMESIVTVLNREVSDGHVWILNDSEKQDRLLKFHKREGVQSIFLSSHSLKLSARYHTFESINIQNEILKISTTTLLQDILVSIDRKSPYVEWAWLKYLSRHKAK